MKAMLLAAGRGERMGPLTADLPKPLLSLGAETLIERHLRRLAGAGLREIVINLSYRGEQIRAAIGDRTPWGQNVAYSEEGEPPLETAGGIVQALPLLGDKAFVVVSTDVVTDHDFLTLKAAGADLECRGDLERTPEASGHLVLVPNPPHHPDGDFGLTPDGRLAATSPRYTFSGLAVLHPALFHGLAPGIRPLRDVLHPAVRRGALRGEVFEGLWRDVGTPGRLAEVREFMATGRPQTSGGAPG